MENLRTLRQVQEHLRGQRQGREEGRVAVQTWSRAPTPALAAQGHLETSCLWLGALGALQKGHWWAEATLLGEEDWAAQWMPLK